MKGFKAAALGMVAVGALAGSAAYAGYRSGWQVGIDTTNRNVYGTIGTVRASSDSLQYIDCAVRTYSSGPTEYMWCEARDVNNVSVSCQSTAQNFIDMARTVTTDSHIYFSYDASGNCTYLFVANGSEYAPKQP